LRRHLRRRAGKMTNLPSFMLSKEQREAAAEADAVCELLTDGIDLPVSDGEEGGFDTLPYLPSDPYGKPSEWAPGGQFYWSRVFQAACAFDHDNIRLLLAKSGCPTVMVNRCMTQLKAKRHERREEVTQCLQLALGSFRQ